MRFSARILSRVLADPLAAYQARVSAGHLARDGAQVHALVLLRRLARTLSAQHNRWGSASANLSSHLDSETPQPPVTFHGSEAGETGNDTHHSRALELEQWLVATPPTTPQAPPGALLTGSPGCGKTMVAELFLDSLPPGVAFRRHYHHLLLEIYAIVNREAARRAREARAMRIGSLPTPRPTELLSCLRRVAQPHAERIASFFRPPVPGRTAAAIAARQAREVALASRQATMAAQSSDPEQAGTLMKHESAVGGAALASAALGTSTLAEYAAAWLFVSHGKVMMVDELQLLDIASAGLIARVLDAYWRLGGTVVATSNRSPQELYAHANVRRSQLQPFLDALEAHCPQISMAGQADFRRRIVEEDEEHDTTNFWFRDESDGFKTRVNQLVRDRAVYPVQLQVYGHTLDIPQACQSTQQEGAMAITSFASLCVGELAGADYLALCSTFPTVVLTHVPQLSLGDTGPGVQGARDQTRRFITLIDAAYETRTQLVVQADFNGGIDELFGLAGHEAAGRQVDLSAQGLHPSSSVPLGSEAEGRTDLVSEQLIQSEVLSEALQDSEEGFRPNISTYDSIREHRFQTSEKDAEPNEQPTSSRADQNSSLFSTEEERFATARALSRLHQMARASWPRSSGSVEAIPGAAQWAPLPRHVLKLWGTKVRWANETLDSADAASESVNDDQARGRVESLFSIASLQPAEKVGDDDPDWPSLPASGNHLASRARQPPTPIRPDHMWGVREDWGKRAGRWGQGAAAFDSEPGEQQNDQPRKK